MSEISVNFNTESQKFAVTIDGKKMPNVVEATVFADEIINFLGQKEDMFMVRVVSREDVDSGNTGKHETITFISQESNEAKEAILGGYGVKAYKGLVQINSTQDESESKLHKEVSKFFGATE